MGKTFWMEPDMCDSESLKYHWNKYGILMDRIQAYCLVKWMITEVGTWYHSIIYKLPVIPRAWYFPSM